MEVEVSPKAVHSAGFSSAVNDIAAFTAPEFGHEIFVDFMPAIPGTMTRPVLVALEFSGDFVVPVELASMKMDDVIRGAQEVVWRMALLTKRKVIVFHVDAERPS